MGYKPTALRLYVCVLCVCYSSTAPLPPSQSPPLTPLHPPPTTNHHRVVMWELLTWQQPYEDMMSVQVLFSVMQSFRPEVPPIDQLPGQPGSQLPRCGGSLICIHCCIQQQYNSSTTVESAAAYSSSTTVEDAATFYPPHPSHHISCNISCNISCTPPTAIWSSCRLAGQMMRPCGPHLRRSSLQLMRCGRLTAYAVAAAQGEEGVWGGGRDGG